MTQLFHLIGFVLAHACWIVADLPKGEAMVPFAVVERADGTHVLTHFEAVTQQEAIDNGKTFLAKPPAEAVRIAFVRDGLLRDADGTTTDVLSVTGWARAQPQIVVSQTYRIDTPAGFRLLGEPFVALGQVADGGRAIADVLAGVGSHPHAGKLWAGWKGPSAAP